MRIQEMIKQLKMFGIQKVKAIQRPRQIDDHLMRMDQSQPEFKSKRINLINNIKDPQMKLLLIYNISNALESTSQTKSWTSIEETHLWNYEN
ncbi:unnamed protein product [Paramecium octaurelia]|uniref:Uncharacterized protein n=1 Tax=Paramecium octaurelia TaxID=43137 RepID=A0A8S1UEW6_PAROT|nr:unnamed protein product [Paramecium octaurelia]